MKLALLAAAAVALAGLPGALAWGREGHEIVATIAERHLTSTAKTAICQIFENDPNSSCNLAPHAMFADVYKKKPEGRWSEPTHYVNPIDDHPPMACEFGKTGFTDETFNVLNAVINQTHQLTQASDVRDRAVALKLLIHLVGDMHQPLHLCGRDRGGTRIEAQFGDNRPAGLHSLWDTYLVQLTMREASKQAPERGDAELESLVADQKYDALVRSIEQDIKGKWRSEVKGWQTCAGGDEGVFLSDVHAQVALGTTSATSHLNTLLACPFAWAGPISRVNCDYVWTTDMDASAPPVQLEGEYWDRVKRDAVIPKLLAQGGLRLAAVLNAALGSAREA